MFQWYYNDPDWYHALAILLLLTGIFIAGFALVSKDPKKNEVDGDGGCGCGCFAAILMFLLCYMWTALIVSMVEYGRPYDGRQKDQKKKNEDRPGQRRVYHLLDQPAGSPRPANTRGDAV